MTHCIERKDRMRVRSAGAHFGRDTDRFHQLLFAGAGFHRKLGVAANAIRALRHMRDSDRNELLGFGRQRAIGGADRLSGGAAHQCGRTHGYCE